LEELGLLLLQAGTKRPKNNKDTTKTIIFMAEPPEKLITHLCRRTQINEPA